MKTIARMQAIDLSQIQPFDIILMTTARKESRLIRLVQALARGRVSKFSHVGMFISPTLFVESSDDGIVFEQFRISNTNLPIDVLKRNSLFRRMSRHKTRDFRLRLIIDDSDKARPKIYGALPDTSELLIRRHKSFVREDENGTSITHFRLKLFEVIKPVYLQLYPEWIRLIGTLDLPNYVRNKIKGWARRTQRVTNPGPFCSELVATIFQRIRPGSLAGNPARWAPADFEDSDQFVDVPCIKTIEYRRRYGTQGHQLAELLNVDATPLVQRKAARIKYLFDLIKHRINAKGRGRDEVVYEPYDSDVYLQFVKQWMFSISDIVFLFIKRAPSCFYECPSRKKDRYANSDLSPLMKAHVMQRCDNIFWCDCFQSSHSLRQTKKRLEELEDKFIHDLEVYTASMV